MRRGRARSAVLVIAALVLMAVLMALAAFGGYLGVRAYRDSRATVSGPTPAAALASATAAPSSPAPATTGIAPSATGVAQALSAALAAPALGGSVHAQVDDVTTGTVLLSTRSAVAAAPASTAKVLTATAVVLARGPDYRIRTQVVAGSSPGTVVLVGGGDPTLTGAPSGVDSAYPDAARISDLAAAVRTAHVPVTRVLVDDSLFSGPSISPAWAPEDIPTDYAAPITAAMLDGGRATPTDVVRSTSPDLDAGRALARAVGVPAAAVTRGTAPAGAKVLATVQSAPISELIAQMLQESDNVIAECLARQVAIARNAPASFLGAAGAIRSVLRSVGVDPGAGLVDGSGLAAADRVSVTALAEVLREVAGGSSADLRTIVAALPVAGWSGTLSDRYGTVSAGGTAAGVVRAKTGTLTAVSSLAGLVRDSDGRLLAFAFIADHVPVGSTATAAAEVALDRAAAALAACGCR